MPWPHRESADVATLATPLGSKLEYLDLLLAGCESVAESTDRYRDRILDTGVKQDYLLLCLFFRPVRTGFSDPARIYDFRSSAIAQRNRASIKTEDHFH